MSSKEKCEQLIVLLKECFPPKIVDAKLFNSDYELWYDNDAGVIMSLVDGKMWNEIDWQFINEKAGDAWMTPSYCNIEAYKQLFPSFLLDSLLDIVGTRKSLLAGLFVEWHLNINNIKYEDRKEFLLSLTDKQKSCIAKILAFLLEVSPNDYVPKEALDSYWIKYL